MRVWSGSEAAVRILERLARQGAALAKDPDAESGFVLLAAGDRRRRPLARVDEDLVAALRADGSIQAGPRGKLVISAAGVARAARERAQTDEGYRAQHDAVIARAWMDETGRARSARGVDPHGPLARVEKLKDANGAPLLSAAEIAAAHTLRADWERGQQGLVKGSDWSAPPRGGSARGPSHDAGPAAALDARRRLAQALQVLAPALSATVQAVCLRESSLSDVERDNAWPARSGKLALKLALAQLAAFYGSSAGGRFQHGAGVAPDALDHRE